MFFELSIGMINGTANITVNGELVSTGGLNGSIFVESGSTVNVVVALDEGYNSFSTFALIDFPSYNTSPFEFTMPTADLRLFFVISGEWVPIDGYGLKYFWEWKSLGGDRRLEIYEDGYPMPPTERKIQNLTYIWGNLGDSPFNSMVGSKIIFDIAASGDDFQEFVTGNNRKFMVKYFHGLDLEFQGYVNTDRMEAPEVSGNFIIKFEALDGVKGFESTRFVSQRIPTTGFLPDSATKYLIGALNQTFVDGRVLNICAEIFEDRMVTTECLFDQFRMPFAAFYEDGEVAKFSDGNRIVNDFLYISQMVTRLVNPFLCRVFLYKNEWYVVRLTDMIPDTMRFFRFNPDGTQEEVEIRANGYDFDCPEFGNANKEHGLIFNEFTSILKLGQLDQTAQGGIFSFPFNLDSWNIGSATSPFAGYYKLKSWEYINAVPYTGSINWTTDISEIQYSSRYDCAVIYKTTGGLGIDDPSLSEIRLNTASSGISIGVVQELANSLSISLEFNALKRRSDTPVNIAAPTRMGMMVKIGDSYLDYDPVDQSFEWVLVPVYMEFRVNVAEAWNTLEIINVVIPESANIEIRITQLLINSGIKNEYALGLRNFKLDVAQTEGLANSAIAYKSETVQDYNRVYPDYVTWIGDALTSNSLSAIKLADMAHSESWTTDENVSMPLQAIQVQELANFKGRKNLRILGKLYRSGIPPLWGRFDYDGKKWIIIHCSYNDTKNVCDLQLFQIDG